MSNAYALDHYYSLALSIFVITSFNYFGGSWETISRSRSRIHARAHFMWVGEKIAISSPSFFFFFFYDPLSSRHHPVHEVRIERGEWLLATCTAVSRCRLSEHPLRRANDRNLVSRPSPAWAYPGGPRTRTRTHISVSQRPTRASYRSPHFSLISFKISRVRPGAMKCAWSVWNCVWSALKFRSRMRLGRVELRSRRIKILFNDASRA